MKHKTLVVVDSEKYLAKANPDNQNNELCTISVGDIFSRDNVKLVGDYKKIKQVFDAREESLKWMKAWPDIKIDGKSFKEVVAYDKTSLWWFVEFWFYNAHSFHDYSILDIFHAIETAERILGKEKPSRVAATGESLLCRVMPLVAASKGMDAAYNQTKNFQSDIRKKIRPTLVKHFKATKEFLRGTQKRKLLHKTRERIKVLIFTHPTYRQTTADAETGNKFVEDTIIGPIIRELKDCDVAVVDTDPFGALRLGFTFRSPEYNHIEIYKNKIIEEKVAKEEKLLKGKLEQFYPHLKKSLAYKGIEMHPLLEQKFSELFHRKFSEVVKYIELAKEAVRMEKPDVVVVVDEYGMYGKAAVFAGEQAGIPTVAVQHGIMSDSNIALFHPSGELTDRSTPLHNPIPDKTLVNGEYYKNFLASFGYPQNSFVPTGQPKYDVLAKAEKIFNKEKTRAELGLKQHEKMLVLASSTQGFPKKENENFMKSLFGAVKKIGGLKLVIKLHPNEYDSSLHKKLAREAGIEFVITKDANTSELLYACDALITISSTVALEAMILGKPVVIANLTGKPDQVPYVEKQAAAGVYKDSDMLPTIKKILFDEKTIKKLEEPRKKFVFDYAYKIDGMAAKRSADMIRGMVRGA